nr:hypothetical protein [Tanacetum cinerariifolium]
GCRAGAAVEGGVCLVLPELAATRGCLFSAAGSSSCNKGCLFRLPRQQPRKGVFVLGAAEVGSHLGGACLDAAKVGSHIWERLFGLPRQAAT